MGIEQSAIPTFAGHQTFHPRFGWIKKGFDAASSNPSVFNEKDAPVQLGVGKNMVDAIRFWCIATRVVQRVPNPERPRMSIALPTGLGTSLLGRNGLDPFLEDSSTLWILHWQAVSAVTFLPIWWVTFNDLSALEFTDDELQRFSAEEIGGTTWAQPNESSIRKDVDCLLRMYTTRETRSRQSFDELLDSPFRELGLITQAPTGKSTYRFVRGRKPGMPDASISYACLDFMAMTDPDARTVSITRLASDPGSPGRLMKLNENDIVAAVEATTARVTNMQLAAPAGSVQLVIDEEPSMLALEVLLEHHSQRGRDGRSLPSGAVAGPRARIAMPEASPDGDVADLREPASRELTESVTK